MKKVVFFILAVMASFPLWADNSYLAQAPVANLDWKQFYAGCLPSLVDQFNEETEIKTNVASKYCFFDFDGDGKQELWLSSENEEKGSIYGINFTGSFVTLSYLADFDYKTSVKHRGNLLMFSRSGGTGVQVEECWEVVNSSRDYGKCCEKTITYFRGERTAECVKDTEKCTEKEIDDYIAGFPGPAKELEPGEWHPISDLKYKYDDVIIVTPSEKFASFDKYKESAVELSTKYKWIAFKQNHAKVNFIDGTYRLQDRSVISTMFRGYQPYSVDVLATTDAFIQTYDFPSYDRWVWGENQTGMGKAFEQEMARKYGRAVKYSQKVASYRQGDGTFAIVEFANKDKKALAVYAWIEGGKVKATYEMYSALDSEDQDCSVWNVDDDGSYGAPGVICIARSKDGKRIELFLTHFAPESGALMRLQVVPSSGSIKMLDWYNWYMPYD